MGAAAAPANRRQLARPWVTLQQLALVDRVGLRALGALELSGAIATFGARAIVEAVRPPYDLREIVRHTYQFGYRSAPLIFFFYPVVTG